MKRYFGWTLFALLIPIMLVGAAAYLFWSALEYGWGWAKALLEDWND